MRGRPRLTAIGCAVALLAVAACQPAARRLLLVDFALTDPLVLDATAGPWHAAGYTVEYRRYYPHFTRSDLRRYRGVVLLGGREPEAPSDAVTLGDLAMLSEWLREGGIVVLGYSGDGEGSDDRWTMNRWLAAVGAGIAIADDPLEDSIPPPAGAIEPQARLVPLPQSALDRAGVAPFPAGRNHALAVRRSSQALARSSATAFARPAGQAPAPSARAPTVAASRVGPGLVVVASRHALAAAGADIRPSTLPAVPGSEELARSRTFLVALARWTRRPAEWAGVAPAAARRPLLRAEARRALAPHPPPLQAPEGADVIRVPRAAAGDQRAGAGRVGVRVDVPVWITRQGIRGLWTRWPYRGFDSLLTVLDIGGFNALATVVPPAALFDSLGSRAAWRFVAERLQATSLRWFPATGLADLRPPGATLVPERDRRGQPLPAWCALDTLFWRGVLRPALHTLARVGGERGEPVAGIALDLDAPGARYAAAGFCDATYREGVAALGLDSADAVRLAGLPPEVRYDSLLERGALGRYYDGLEGAVANRAAALRAELRTVNPDLRVVVRSAAVPTDWFAVGLLRGLSSGDLPILLWTRERRTRELLARFGERGAALLSAVALAPDRLAPRDWSRLRRLAFGEHDGFWLTGTAAPALHPDSLARLIRRLAK